MNVFPMVQVDVLPINTINAKPVFRSNANSTPDRKKGHLELDTSIGNEIENPDSKRASDNPRWLRYRKVRLKSGLLG